MRLIQESVLYEDKEIIVCRKAAGIATQTKKTGEQDMESLLKNYLKTPYIGIVHRLDQPVEGILVFGKNSSAAAVLSGQKMEKLYYAAVLMNRETIMAKGVEKEDTLVDYLVKNGRDNTSSVADKTAKDAKRAELAYAVVRVSEEEVLPGLFPVLVRVRLNTGRHHQIRVQMANAGMPLLGDNKYGNTETKKVCEGKNIKDIALCAYGLSFCHPQTKKKMKFETEPQSSGFQIFFPLNP